MDFEEQRRRANAVLDRKGISRAAAEPPYGLLFRALGLKVRPLPFESFWRIVFYWSAQFAPIWGTVMWFWQWREDGTSLAVAVLAALLTGLGSGLAMACYVAWSRKKYQLPTWESLATPPANRKA